MMHRVVWCCRPPYDQHYHADGDVLDEAVRRAPEEGAGTLVWRKSGGLLAFAVVLEPEKALREARLAFFAGMSALGDALAAHCAPDKPLRFAFPDTVPLRLPHVWAARVSSRRKAVARMMCRTGWSSRWN